MQARYAVMDKSTGQLFAGFDAEKNPIWTAEESKATAYAEKIDARGQALLFVCHGIKAQKKTVEILKRPYRE